jgi:CRISPR-associated protein Cst1
VKDVVIYPSSWYYNACVQGFLEVLAWGLGENGPQIVEEQFLQDDGRVVIPGELVEAIFSSQGTKFPQKYEFKEVPGELQELKRIAWWWVEYTGNIFSVNHFVDVPEEVVDEVFNLFLIGEGIEKIAKNLNEFGYSKCDGNKWNVEDVTLVIANNLYWCKLAEDKQKNVLMEFVFRQMFSKGKTYQNLTQLIRGETSQLRSHKIRFLNDWFCKTTKGELICSFCNSPCTVGDTSRKTLFSLELSKMLGSSVGEFPNSFWDSNSMLVMCDQCRSFFICFHLIADARLRDVSFVNTGNLSVNWHIKRLLGENDKTGKSSTLLSQKSEQVKGLMGMWAKQGIEVIKISGSDVKVYEISDHILDIMLNFEIQNLLGKLRYENNPLEELVLDQKIADFLLVIYKHLNRCLAGFSFSKKEDRPKDRYLNSDLFDEKMEIKKGLRYEKQNSFIQNCILLYQVLIKEFADERRLLQLGRLIPQDLIKCADTAPASLTVKSQSGSVSGLIFKLLELTRLGKRNEVYYVLLRAYLAEGKQLPPELNTVFQLEHTDDFKNYIYAYISGLNFTKKQADNEKTTSKEGSVSDD